MLAVPQPRRRWLFPAAIALLAALAAFVLPWALPPTHPAYGQSYVVGFNNKLAIALLGLLSLAVLAIALRRRSTTAAQAVSQKLSPLHLLILAAATLLWLGTILWMLDTAGLRSTENSYFLPQMEKVFYHHKTLYSQVEFPYGPLLFYPPLILAHFLKSTHALDTAYDLTLLLEHLIGLGMLFVILNRLPLSRFMRLAMFYILGSYSLNPWLGLNYTLFRFLTCFFCLTVLAQIARPWFACAWAFLAAILILFTSPDMGIAFLAGVLAYSTVRALNHAKGAFLSAASALTAGLLYFLTAPPDLLKTIGHFSTGFHNTPLLPSPDILISLAAAVWFAPLALASALKAHTPSSPMLAGFYVSSLALVPSMLGPADPMHVLSNSLGFLLLAAVCVSSRITPQRAWVAATAATYLFFFFLCTVGVRYQLSAALKCDDPHHRLASLAAKLSPFVARKMQKVEGAACTSPLQEAAWTRLTHNEPFMIPLSYDPRLLEVAVRSTQYKPSYFYAQIPMWNPAAQQLQVDELRRVSWALLPAQIEPHSVSPDSDILPNFSTHFPLRHTIFRDELVAAEIREHWVPITTLAPGLALYHRTQ